MWLEGSPFPARKKEMTLKDVGWVYCSPGRVPSRPRPGAGRDRKVSSPVSLTPTDLPRGFEEEGQAASLLPIHYNQCHCVKGLGRLPNPWPSFKEELGRVWLEGRQQSRGPGAGRGLALGHRGLHRPGSLTLRPGFPAARPAHSRGMGQTDVPSQAPGRES